MTDTGELYHPPDSAASSVYHNDLTRSEIVKAINKNDDINTLIQFALSSKDGYDSSLRYLRRKVTRDQVKEWRHDPVSPESLEDPELILGTDLRMNSTANNKTWNPFTL